VLRFAICLSWRREFLPKANDDRPGPCPHLDCIAPLVCAVMCLRRVPLPVVCGLGIVAALVVGETMISINGEIHSSKNSRKIWHDSTGKTRIVKSDTAKADEQSFLLQLNTQREKWAFMLAEHYRNGADRNAPLEIVFRFRRGTAARFDYVNIAQGVCDAMVKAEYLEDDSANYLIPVFEPYVIDRVNPGCDFWII